MRPLIKSDRYDLTNWRPWGLSGLSEGLNAQLESSCYCCDPTLQHCGEQTRDLAVLSFPCSPSFDISWLLPWTQRMKTLLWLIIKNVFCLWHSPTTRIGRNVLYYSKSILYAVCSLLFWVVVFCFELKGLLCVCDCMMMQSSALGFCRLRCVLKRIKEIWVDCVKRQYKPPSHYSRLYQPASHAI